jgi:hypothetical protein
MTKEEHNKIKMDKFTGLWDHVSDKVFKIDWRLGHFTSNKVAGFHFTKQQEGNFIMHNFKDKIETKPDLSKNNENAVYYIKKF